MRGSVLLRRTIALLLFAVLLSGAFTAGIYILVTQRQFVRMRSAELMPIARNVAQTLAEETDAEEPGRSVWSLFGRESRGVLGSTLLLFDASGAAMTRTLPGETPLRRDAALGANTVSRAQASSRATLNGGPQPNSGAEPQQQDNGSADFIMTNAMLSRAVRGDVKTILAGQEVSTVRRAENGQSYLVVGVPVMKSGKAAGAVVFVKSISELTEAMSGLNVTLLVSSVAAFLIMLVPGYFAARRITVPIRQMRDVARAMARGDFSIRADETQKGELGELGRSINHFAVESARLEQTRRDYVANVSHELRTPIAAIRAMGETLRDGLVKGEEKEALYYDSLVRESMRLSRLVDDLLELSRVQSGTAAMQKERFDLRRSLQSMADIYSFAAQEAGVQFTLAINENAPLPVFSSADRIEQVLVILLDNAIRHTPSGGRVTLAVRESAELVEVRVEDTGEGIPPEDIGHIFERFYKVDKSHSGGGTGLGLSIAREVLAGLGERIRVESSPERTSFLFTVHRRGTGDGSPPAQP